MGSGAVGAGGISIDIEKLETTRYIFAGTKMTLVVGGKAQAKGDFKVHSSSKPAAIDLSNGEELSRGIYKIEKGQLTLCLPVSKQGFERPKEFTAREAPGTILIVLKRVD